MKITDVDYQYFMRYSSLFYSNMGNYLDNDSKVVPNLTIQKFEDILKTSNKFEEIKYIWECVRELIFDKDSSQMNNKNSFYLGGIKKEQILTVDKFLHQHGINPINTRLIKSSNKLVYLVASTKKTNIEWEGTNIVGHYGKNNY